MKISLKTKIRLNVMLILIPFLFLGYFYYQGVLSTANEKMKIESQKIVNNISDLYIEEYISNLEQDFPYLFGKISINDFYNITEYSKIIKKWETYRQINKDAWFVYFASKYNKLYVIPTWIAPSNYDMTNRPWYINAYENPYDINWSEPYKEAVTKDLVVTASKVYRGSEGEIIGIGAVDLTLENLSNMLRKIDIGKGAEIFIVDSSNKIIAHPQYSKVWKTITNNDLLNDLKVKKEDTFSTKNDIYYAFKTIDKTGWKVVAKIPDETLKDIIKPVKSNIYYLIIFTVILFFIIQYIITNNIFYHFNNISYSLLNLKKGNYDLDLNNKKFEEVKELYANFTEVINKIDKLNKDTIIDPLTNLYNRRYLDRKIEEFKENKTIYSMLMLDIDDFKVVNDIHGHKFGDYILKKIGFIIYSNVRNEDVAIRYGGEEFLVIFNGEDKDIINKLTENIRKDIESNEWPKDVKITVSGGLTYYDDDTKDLLNLADELLYRSKNEGKNKIYTK